MFSKRLKTHDCIYSMHPILVIGELLMPFQSQSGIYSAQRTGISDEFGSQ